MMTDNKYRENKRILFTISITVNLSLLFIFKYYNFFTESFLALFNISGEYTYYSSINIILPLGISFYTFQVISYLVDVMNGRSSPCKSILPFASYVCFFPQLIAGPIERAKSLIPQFANPKKFSYYHASLGCRAILLGLFKKVAIADQCAIHVDRIFSSNVAVASSGILFIGVTLFAIQIYCDFSGYSDIAVGCAAILGIRLSKNFNYPYFSLTIKEFWRKWHITLSKWFKDYVYVPLGGNQKNNVITARNIIITFIISGLWHGANFTFIIWGMIHAIAIIIQMYFMKITNSIYPNTSCFCFNRIILSLSTLYTILIGWIFFRSQTVLESWSYIYYLHTNLFIGYPLGRSINDIINFIHTNLSLFALILFCTFVSLLCAKLKIPILHQKCSTYISWPIYILMIISIIGNSESTNRFIYFVF
jgi:alginate O-acetyltransferase complex protein AlgI